MKSSQKPVETLLLTPPGLVLVSDCADSLCTTDGKLAVFVVKMGIGKLIFFQFLFLFFSVMLMSLLAD